MQRTRPWMLVSAAWIAPAILGGIGSIAQQRIHGGPKLDVGDVLFVTIDWLIYALLTPGVFALSARWPIQRPYLVRRSILHFIFALLFCVVWAGLGTILKIAVQPNELWGTPLQHFASWVFVTFPFGVAVYLSVVGVEHATRYLVQVARLSEQLSSARLAALQAQLNPHFLFNSLNTIAVLVRGGDNTKATRVVEQLSDVLRRTLSNTQSNEVALEDELELVRQYLAVEQARFSDRLRPQIDVPTELLSAAVPCFALQHLVENAVRHGIAKKLDSGLVTVTAHRNSDMLVITVTDDGAGIASDAKQEAGHGLANTRERLRTLYGDRASLTVTAIATGGTSARLTIPYREMMYE